jgi:2-iminoacetate synthase ThiH
MDADDARQTLWPEAVVTYTVGYPLSVGSDAELGEVAAAITRGATGLVLSARQSPSLNSVLADVTLGNPADVFQELKSAGLALFGNAAEAAHTDWVAIHRAAHRAGLPSIAVLTLRSSDSAEDWVSLLDQVALLQAETQGFLACEPRIEHMERTLDEVTGAQYLKMVALCRLYLPTVPHIQVDWRIFGPKVLQVALRFGADDAGLVVASERDLRVPSHHSGEEELRRIIRDAGFQPSQRDAVYGRQFVH